MLATVYFMKRKYERKFDVSYETTTAEVGIIKGYVEKIYLYDNETIDDLIIKIEARIRHSYYPTTYKYIEITI